LLGSGIEFHVRELGEEPRCTHEPNRIALEILFPDGAKNTVPEVFDAVYAVPERSTRQMPDERIAGEIATLDILIQAQGSTRPQLDLELWGLDSPYSVFPPSEEVRPGVESCCQPACGGGCGFDRAWQDEIEIGACSPQQAVADVAPGNVTLRRSESLPNPTQEQIAVQGIRVDSGHRGSRIVDRIRNEE
jgi:hypothetical protein